MSKSLLSIFKKERPWANSSCRSLQKNDGERIALVAKNQRFALKYRVFDHFSLIWPFLFPRANHSSISSLYLKKTSDSLENPESEFPTLIVLDRVNLWTILNSQRFAKLFCKKTVGIQILWYCTFKIWLFSTRSNMSDLNYTCT